MSATPSAEAASAPTPILSDPFYTYAGSIPLAKIAPGTPLKTRSVTYTIQGIPLPLTALQILYRTRNQLGVATVNVTSVIRPLVPITPAPRVLSYQSAYDSLNPADEPSAAIAGSRGSGASVANGETPVILAALLAGDTVNIPDTEGQSADFGAGPEYGINTLDSLRAVARVPATGTGPGTKIALLGYSGGAIATEWAAEEAPSYAPDVARRIVGSAFGGVFVDPLHNLDYVSGSLVWSGALAAVVGIARSFHVDLRPYLNTYGKELFAKFQNASLADLLGRYPGLSWRQLVMPQYASPQRVAVLVNVANRLIMGTAGTPTSPLLIAAGTRGELEGTRSSSVYGDGDGVMIAGDVRTLAREYCSRGATVQYQQYALSHFTTALAWLPVAFAWIQDRFAGKAAPSNCGEIAPGNSIAALKRQ